MADQVSQFPFEDAPVPTAPVATPAPVQSTAPVSQFPFEDTAQTSPVDPHAAKVATQKQNVVDYEAAKDFDYGQSPLRYIMNEDNARQLVRSQRTSDDANKAFSIQQENAILMGAGNWLDKLVHGEDAEAKSEALVQLHPTASKIGETMGNLQDAVGEVGPVIGAAKNYAIKNLVSPLALEGEVPSLINLGKAAGTDAAAFASRIGDQTSKVINYLKPAAEGIKNAVQKWWAPVAIGTEVARKGKDITDRLQ